MVADGSTVASAADRRS